MILRCVWSALALAKLLTLSSCPQSQLVGEWQQGQLTSGTWRLKDTGEFVGSFKDGKPDGQGKFALSSGITHSGKYLAVPNADAAEDEEAAPAITWQGDAVYSC